MSAELELPLSQVLVFEKTGRVLWRRGAQTLKGDPLAELVGAYLLEEKGGSQKATIGDHALDWRFVNEADLVVVTAAPRSLELDWTGELCDGVRRKVAALAKTADVGEALKASFDPTFDGLEKEFGAKLRLRRKKEQAEVEARKARSADAAQRRKEAEAEEEEEVEDDDEDPLARLKRRTASKSSPGRKNRKKKTEDKAGKKPTVWRDGSQRNKKATAAEVALLDRSGDKGDAQAQKVAQDRHLQEMRGTYMKEEGERAAWEEEEELLLEDESDDDQAPKGWFGRNVGNLLQNVGGTQTLTREEIEPVMEELKNTLLEKNVAVEVADAVTQSVSDSLVGQKVERFGRVSTMIKQALAAAVERVLTPKRSTDVLREVLDAKAKHRGPYSIVFVGINGVGKSTTLSKVAYYLKEHGIDVMITACDTFRSGAVEQLRSHANCLDVELFEKGYLKDPADVARASLVHAKQAKKDCVLIDTAGRMQNNDKLMRELATLVSVNTPDLVLFVGEALVGNDGIDQLNMFNNSLAQFCPDGRTIDGLVLTKFDTIDDKVGATLSMTYKTGQPIMFIGCGQKYTHLKKLSVNAVVNSLFK